MKKLIILLLFSVMFTCERDDICAESTTTTPHLIIRFNDIINTDNSKQVRQLTVTGENIETPIVFRTNTDSISLPLRFQDEGSITTTRFVLTRDADYEVDDMNPNTNPNSDTIEVIYTPQFVYVSRACGFRSIFTETELVIASDANNWIFSSEIINATIDTETNAHIILRH